MGIGRFSREGFAQRKSPRERREDTIRLELDEGSPLTMLKGAQISWPTGAPVKCIVRDLSHTGAKVEVSTPVPDTFDLVFGDQSRRSCTVAWRKETQLGVKFVVGGVHVYVERLLNLRKIVNVILGRRAV